MTESNYPVQHQGINEYLHSMKVHLHQLGLGLCMCQWRVDNVTPVLRKLMPWTLWLRTLYFDMQTLLTV